MKIINFWARAFLFIYLMYLCLAAPFAIGSVSLEWNIITFIPILFIAPYYKEIDRWFLK